MNIIDHLIERNLIQPPGWLRNNVHYTCLMGSIAYGCNTDTSDQDLYGFCIPPKDIIFPHLRGEIEGFGTKLPRFEQFQQHHVLDKSSGNEYDINIYNIVKYFQLILENNPNMVDSLFVPQRCILHISKIGGMLRDNRHMFLHKGSYFRLKSYAFSQLNKMNSKSIKKFVEICNKYELSYDIQSDDVVYNNSIPSEIKTELLLIIKEIDKSGKRTKRVKDIAKHGYDLKFAYNIIRLVNQCEQILMEHDLDLERNREQLKSIRRGEWSLDDITEYFHKKELILNKLYAESTLRHSPNEDDIKQLLLNCLEEHYQNLDGCIESKDKYKLAVYQIQEIVANSLKNSS